MSELTETAYGHVEAWECDYVGHYNVQFYLRDKGLADTHFRLMLGLPAANLHGQECWIKLLETHIRYHGELRCSDIMVIRSGVIEHDDATMIVLHEMRKATTDALAATFVTKWQWTDRESGVPQPWAKEVRAKIEQHQTTLPQHAERRSARKFGDPETLSDRSPKFHELPCTHKSIVMPKDADAHDCLTEERTIASLVTSGSHLWAKNGINWASLREQRLGSVMVEGLIYHRTPLIIGNAYETRFYNLHVGGKAFSFRHLLINSSTGKLCMTYDGTALLMDLDQRKAVPFSEAQQKNLKENLATL